MVPKKNERKKKQQQNKQIKHFCPFYFCLTNQPSKTTCTHTYRFIPLHAMCTLYTVHCIAVNEFDSLLIQCEWASLSLFFMCLILLLFLPLVGSVLTALSKPIHIHAVAISATMKAKYQNGIEKKCKRFKGCMHIFYAQAAK